MTDAETKALELVAELSSVDEAIADTRKKIATLREKQTALAVDTETAPAKLAAQIKKCADDIEVAESTIEIIEQRKRPVLKQVQPLLKSLATEHRLRETEAKQQNVEQARKFIESPEVRQAMSLVGAAFWYFKNARGLAGFGWDDLFKDADEMNRLYDEQPAFKRVSESDAQQQLRAWSHQAEKTERDAHSDQTAELRFG